MPTKKELLLKKRELLSRRKALIESEKAKEQRGSIADPLGQGAMFGFGDELAGVAGASINSVLNLFGKGTGESFSDAYQGVRDVARENLEAYRDRKPGTALAAEIVGGFLPGAGLIKAGAGAGKTIAQQLPRVVGAGMLEGGAYGVGSSDARTLDEARAAAQKGATIGGLASAAFPIAGASLRGAGKLLTRPNDTKLFQNAVNRLKDEGVTSLTTGAKTGSKSLRGAESTLSRTFFGGKLDETITTARKQFQKALMKKAGFDKNSANIGLFTDNAIDAAQDRFSRRYSSLLAGSKVKLGNKYRSALNRIRNERKIGLPSQEKVDVDKIIDEFKGLSSLSGRQYQKYRALLRENAGNSPQRKALYTDIKKALDDAFADSIPASRGSAKFKVDREYNRFKILRESFEASSGETTEGFLPLASTANRVKKRADREFRQLMLDGVRVLREPFGSSGTAERAISTAVLESPAGLALLANEPFTAALAGISPIAASQMFARGSTGSALTRGIGAGGLLSAPGAVSLFNEANRNYEEAPQK